MSDYREMSEAEGDTLERLVKEIIGLLKDEHPSMATNALVAVLAILILGNTGSIEQAQCVCEEAHDHLRMILSATTETAN